MPVLAGRLVYYFNWLVAVCLSIHWNNCIILIGKRVAIIFCTLGFLDGINDDIKRSDHFFWYRHWQASINSQSYKSIIEFFKMDERPSPLFKKLLALNFLTDGSFLISLFQGKSQIIFFYKYNAIKISSQEPIASRGWDPRANQR